MGRKRRKSAKLRYPKHVLKPEDLLHFIYDDGFLSDCEEIDLREDDIAAIEIAIMAGLSRAPVIQGTGGLRKLRFVPERWNTGKSGAARVLFVYFADVWSVMMVAAYKKSEYDNISNSAKAIYKS